MRHAALGCALALACVTPATAFAFAFDAPTPAPQARVRFGDLPLATPHGQNALVERVLDAARLYCRDHAAIVSPPERRSNPGHCIDSMRVQLVQAMPDEARSAYRRGWMRRRERP